jgi:hypothetical protein
MLRTYTLCIILVITGIYSCRNRPVPPQNFISKAYADSLTDGKFKSIPNVKAGTKPISVSLPDGRKMWFFASSNIYDNATAGFMQCSPNVANMAMVESGGALALVNSSAIPLLSTANAPLLEPISAYYFYDTVFCFAKQQNATNSALYVAKFIYPSLSLVSVDTLKQPKQILFGLSSATVLNFGFCYSYGLRQPIIDGPNSLYLARFSVLTPNSPWSYFNGSNWSLDQQDATPIQTIPSSHFDILAYNQDFALITQTPSSCSKASSIDAYYGTNEYGPWINKQTYYTINKTFQNNYPVSQAITFHPSDINSKKEILCSYSLDGYGSCASSCTGAFMSTAHRSTYFVRVPLNQIYAAW